MRRSELIVGDKVAIHSDTYGDRTAIVTSTKPHEMSRGYYSNRGNGIRQTTSGQGVAVAVQYGDRWEPTVVQLRQLITLDEVRANAAARRNAARIAEQRATDQRERAERKASKTAILFAMLPVDGPYVSLYDGGKVELNEAQIDALLAAVRLAQSALGRDDEIAAALQQIGR